jgi:hypothetical protein
MKRFLSPVLASLMLAAFTAFCLVSAFNAGMAYADPVIPDAGVVDVGSGSGSGSAIVVATTGSGTPSVVIIDPSSDPSATLSMWVKLYKSGAFFALGIVVLFGILYVLDEKIAWLREGKRGVYLAAALGGLAVVFVPASQGSTPTLAMFMTALTTAVALIINPKPQPSPTSSS